MKHKLYKGVRRVWEGLQSIVFPPFCWHCEQATKCSKEAFCTSCQSLLELLTLEGRCPRCFAGGYDRRHPWCRECRDRTFFWVAAGSAFDYQGPAKALVGILKRHEWPQVARGAAGYMVAQMLRMNWPIPDVIVPVPISSGRKFFRGHNQAELLAQGVGHIFQRPVSDCLWRPTEVPKTRLCRKERLLPGRCPMRLENLQAVRDAVVLLVDDVLTTGATLQESAQALVAGFPKAIYGMTLCRASRSFLA